MSGRLPAINAPTPTARLADRDADAPGEVALDCWLRLELGRLYGAAVTEPLPDALTALLDAAGAARADRG
jgi:hypothetical protein